VNKIHLNMKNPNYIGPKKFCLICGTSYDCNCSTLDVLDKINDLIDYMDRDEQLNQELWFRRLVARLSPPNINELYRFPTMESQCSKKEDKRLTLLFWGFAPCAPG